MAAIWQPADLEHSLSRDRSRPYDRVRSRYTNDWFQGYSRRRPTAARTHPVSEVVARDHVALVGTRCKQYVRRSISRLGDADPIQPVEDLTSSLCRQHGRFSPFSGPRVRAADMTPSHSRCRAAALRRWPHGYPQQRQRRKSCPRVKRERRPLMPDSTPAMTLDPSSARPLIRLKKP